MKEEEEELYIIFMIVSCIQRSRISNIIFPLLYNYHYHHHLFILLQQTCFLQY
jgi:hypothetical protein